MKDIRPALRTFLLGHPPLSTAVGGSRIYPIKLPQGVISDSIIYNRISGAGTYTMEGLEGFTNQRFQFDSVSLSADSADSLANLIRDRMDGYRGAMGTITVFGVFMADQRDDYDDTTKLVRMSRDYMISFPGIALMPAIKETVKVEGLAELKEAFDDLTKSTQGNVLKRAISAAAADFAEAAAQLAPKKTGKLKRSIKVGKAKIISAGKAAYAAAKADGADNAEAASAARNANRQAGGTGKQAVVHAGPTKSMRAAVPQEFGTVKMPPHAFMRPAWDQNKVRMLGTIADTLAEEIDKAAKRAAKKAAKLIAANK